jgi:hypothetical protein
MRLICLTPKKPSLVVKEIKNGRNSDRLISTSGPGEAIQYVIELPTEGLKKSAAAVMITVDREDLAKIKPILLESELGWDCDFKVHWVSYENIEWFSVCVTLAQKQYSPWLNEQNIAVERAKHWFESGDFEPKQLDEIAWYTAILWRKWRKQKLAWKECVMDLEKFLDSSITGTSSETFNAALDRIRKLSKRLELHHDW